MHPDPRKGSESLYILELVWVLFMGILLTLSLLKMLIAKLSQEAFDCVFLVSFLSQNLLGAQVRKEILAFLAFF